MRHVRGAWLRGVQLPGGTIVSISNKRTVIRGVRGLGHVVCLSAILTTLGQAHGVNRVRAVRAARGEIEVDGAPTRDAVARALIEADALLAQVRAELADDVVWACDVASHATLVVIEADAHA